MLPDHKKGGTAQTKLPGYATLAIMLEIGFIKGKNWGCPWPLIRAGCGFDIARLIRVPSAMEVDAFAKERWI